MIYLMFVVLDIQSKVVVNNDGTHTVRFKPIGEGKHVITLNIAMSTYYITVDACFCMYLSTQENKVFNFSI